MAAPLQTIINLAETIQFNRRRVVGTQVTRNEIVKVSETPTRNPWRMSVGLSAAMPYHLYRDVIEGLDYLDRRLPETISFSSVTGQSFLCQYQGQLNASQLSGLRTVSFAGNQLILNALPSTNAVPNGQSSFVFKKGDFIQIGTNPYPFTVTEDVLRGSGSTVTVTTHRPNFLTSGYTTVALAVGNAVQFKMICLNMPTYTLTPGSSSALIQFDSNFELTEYLGEA